MMKNTGSMSLPPFYDDYRLNNNNNNIKNSYDENQNKFKQNPIKERYFKFALSHSLIYNNQRFHCRKISSPSLAQNQDPALQQQQQQQQQQLLHGEATGSQQAFNLVVSHEDDAPVEVQQIDTPAIEKPRQTRNTSSSRSFNWLRRSPCHQKKVASEESSVRHIRHAGASSLNTPDCEDRQQRRRRFLSCSGLGAAEEASAFYDITNGAATTTTTTTNSSDNNNEEEIIDKGPIQQQQQTPFLLLDCGCCSGQMSMGTNRRFLLNEYPPDGSQLTSLEDAVMVVDDLRLKFRCRGQQIIGYRRKLRQQRSELNHLRAAQRKQLEEISAQLLIFEASLRSKEKQLQETLQIKDQVILKQQRVIKRLLKKSHQNVVVTSCSVEDDLTPQTSLEIVIPSLHRNSTTSLPIRSKSEPEYEAQNDSDSAIMLEDSFTEVSLAVPDLRNITNGILAQPDTNPDDNSFSGTEIRVSRSISDVVNKQRQETSVVAVVVSTPPGADCRRQQQAATSDNGEQQQQQQKQLAGRKTKEERRISNRQKLLLLKRHSGYLKRPEILETVYSVEEDSEQTQQQQQHYHHKATQPKPPLQQQQQVQQQPNQLVISQTPKLPDKTSDRRLEELKLSSSGSGEGNLGTSSPRPHLMRTTSVTSNDSPCLSRRSSASTSCVLTGFRYRIDSDITDADYSTDDDSTRLFYSETDGDHSGGGTCSCSQPCSRRSSYGYTNSMDDSQICHCAQCLAHPRISASAPTSRRSSYGSHFNVNKDGTSPSHNNNNNGSGVQSGVSVSVSGTEGEGEAEVESKAATPSPSSCGEADSPTKPATTDGGDEAKVFNRVMSNHRAVLKPKDVKFKRINKAKARSLEELRDKLKWEQMLESVSAEEVASNSLDLTDSVSNSKASPSTNRLALIREFMARSASFEPSLTAESGAESSVA